MKRKRLIKSLFSTLLAMAIIISTNIPVLAAAPNTEEITGTTEGSVVFKYLDENSEQSYTGIDANGEEYTVAIEEVKSLTRAATRTWKIWYVSGVVNCHFYMDVSNNKCTSVYDRYIATFGCNYSGATLSRTSTYGKLLFDVSLQNILQGTCWLKGTVTGSYNEVSVSWSM